MTEVQPTTGPCPSRDDLAAFAAGDLPRGRRWTTSPATPSRAPLWAALDQLDEPADPLLAGLLARRRRNRFRPGRPRPGAAPPSCALATAPVAAGPAPGTPARQVRAGGGLGHGRFGHVFRRSTRSWTAPWRSRSSAAGPGQPRGHRPLPPRGPQRRPAQAPRRSWRSTRPARHRTGLLPGRGVRPGRDLAAAAPGRAGSTPARRPSWSPASPRPCDYAHAPRRHPPRHQAVEHPDRRRGPAAPDGLRPGQARRRRDADDRWTARCWARRLT